MDIETARLAYRQLADDYARAADRGASKDMRRLFTDDGEIISPRGRFAGSAIDGIPAMLRKRYAATRHEMANQTLVVANGGFSGETYATANHCNAARNGRIPMMVWKLRYRDRLVVRDGLLLLSRRELVVEWTEFREVLPPDALDVPDPAG